MSFKAEVDRDAWEARQGAARRSETERKGRKISSKARSIEREKRIGIVERHYPGCGEKHTSR